MVATNVFQVFGPPGTGKTTSLAAWLKRQAQQYGPHNVMACSYTKAAATEIAGRDLGVPKKNVGTLHAICFRQLGFPKLTAGEEAGFNENGPPEFHLTKEGGDPDEPFTDNKGETHGDKMLAKMDEMRAKMVPRDLWKTEVRRFAVAWDDWKLNCGLLDFTDLLEVSLRDCDEAPGSPAVGVLDECQDSPKLQLELALKWASHMEKFILAGDDDQALYAWCGAVPGSFLDLPIPPENKTVLAQSYRVPRAVHELAEKWVKGLSRRHPKLYKPRDEDGEVRRLGATIRLPERAVDLAESFINAGKSVMFLCSYNRALDSIRAVLRKRAIPFHNPYRRKRGDWNPLVRGSKGRTMPVDRVLSLLATDSGTWGEDAVHFWTWHQLWAWTECLEAKGVFRKGAKEWLKGKKGDTEPADPGEFLSWVEDSSAGWFDEIECGVRERPAAALDAWLGRLLREKRRTLEYPAAVAKHRGGAALLAEPKVILGTIHSVKGGQADVVFLFPDVSRPAMQEWLGGPDGRDAVRRTFYVGITRARETLVLCEPATPLCVKVA